MSEETSREFLDFASAQVEEVHVLAIPGEEGLFASVDKRTLIYRQVFEEDALHHFMRRSMRQTD